MKETAKLLKLKDRIKAFADERDSQALYLIGQYNNLSKEIELTTNPVQASRSVTEVAYYLKKIYEIAREQIEKLSETESTLINKYRKVCNFFINASSPALSFFIKKINNDFLNSKVLTESFFLGLAREMLSIDNVKQNEKDAKENERIPSDPKLSILEQLEMIIVLKDHDEANKYLNNCKDFIDEIKSSVEAGVLQSTFQTSRKLAAHLQLLFNIAQNNNELQAICVLFRDFADMEEQSKPCVSNCVRTSQSTSEKLALSIAKVILQEEGFFNARPPTESNTQPKFRFSRYQTTFSPITLERSLTTPSLPTAPSFPEASFRNSLTQ